MAFIRRIWLTGIIAILLFCLIAIFIYNPPSNSDQEIITYDFSMLNGTKVIFDDTSSLPNNSSKVNDYSQWKDFFTVPPEYKPIVESIKYLNYHHEIRNENQFGSVNQSTFVITIQVHGRLNYLKYLIESLRNVKGIENVLLVFTHDLISEPINDAIEQIDFCRVIQLLFPYNIQVFSNNFSVLSPNENAKEAVSPDKSSHYIISSYAQIKHHWWWKTGMIFDGIMKRYGLDTYTVFLEEDHYVAPDFLHVLKIMVEKKDEFCQNCKILSLGSYPKNYNTYRADINQLGIYKWYSSKHNMGMAFNTSVWNEIRECSKLFCTYDDYNWDWSMLQVTVNCMKEKLRVLTIKSPRVIHVGECGIHFKRCDNVDKGITSASALFKQNSDVFFPKNLMVTEVSQRTILPSKPNGGWNDPHDHQLCLQNSYPVEMGSFLPETLLNYSSLLLPFDRGFNKTMYQY